MKKPRSASNIRDDIRILLREYHDVVHSPKTFVPGRTPCPVSGKVFDSAEMVALNDANLDFWLTSGRFNSAFEKKIISMMGVKTAHTVNSGSSANLCALAALTTEFLGENALKPGDEVLTCATGFPTTVNPIIQLGLIPVFVDAEIPTYNISTNDLEEAISRKTRAIMLAHTLGNPFNLDAVMSVAKKHNLFVIEDCCDGLGSTYKGKSIGSFGEFGTLSFYPAHHITTGEGGCVFSKNKKLKRALESVRDWGRDCWCDPGVDNTCKKRFSWKLGALPHGYDHKYTYSSLGYNLKMTDMQAAIGLAQMAKVEEFVKIRRRNFEMLKEGLCDLSDELILPMESSNAKASWFGFPISVTQKSAKDRDTIVRELNDSRIATRLLFGGNLVRQPYMSKVDYRVHGPLDNSDFIMANSFWVGVYPGLSVEHIRYMISTIRRIVKKK